MKITHKIAPVIADVFSAYCSFHCLSRDRVLASAVHSVAREMLNRHPLDAATGQWVDAIPGHERLKHVSLVLPDDTFKVLDECGNLYGKRFSRDALIARCMLVLSAYGAAHVPDFSMDNCRYDPFKGRDIWPDVVLRPVPPKFGNLAVLASLPHERKMLVTYTDEVHRFNLLDS